MEQYDLKGSDKEFTAAKKILLSRIIQALSSRFNDKDAGVVQATSILDFSAWPDSETPGANIDNID